jgi:hypothetical protein
MLGLSLLPPFCLFDNNVDNYPVARKTCELCSFCFFRHYYHELFGCYRPVLAGFGPMTPPGKRVQTINSPGSEVGPGTVATWGKAITNEVDAMGFKWE